MEWVSSRMISGAIAYLGKCVLVAAFFRPLEKRTEGPLHGLGALCMLGFLPIYFTTESAVRLATSHSAGNLMHQFARMLLHEAVVFGYLVLNKELTRQAALYQAGMFTAISLAAESIRWVSITIVEPAVQSEIYRRFTVCVMLLVLWLIMEVVHRYIDLRSIQEVGGGRRAVIATTLVLELYFKWALITLDGESAYLARRYDMILFAFFAAFGVLLVLLLYEANLQAQNKKAQAEAEQLRVEYEMQNAKRTLQANNDIRRMYHDMKNHLLAIQSMTGASQELDAYLKELLPHFDGYENRVATGNTVVDALLAEKMQRAALDHIRFNIVLDLQPLSFVKSVDLITIIGNAVDNAVEAVQMLPSEEKRIVYIKSSRFANMVVLRFSNQYVGRIEQSGGHLLTHKQDTALHGIGIKSIRKAAQSYGGSADIEFDNEEKWFRLMVMLPVKAGE